MGRSLGDQQLVIHAFIDLDTRQSAESYRALSRLWQRCRDLLGITVPVAGLPSTLPQSSAEASSLGPGGVLAALEERDHYRQMVVRRVQNIINFSMAFTDKREATVRRRIGAASPPGWVEYDRWWREMAEQASPEFLGLVRLYLATSTLVLADVAGAVRDAVPAAAHGRFWWERGQVRNQFALWEWSPEREPAAQRRIIVVERADAGTPSTSWALSEWAWSSGDPALPPLARYFLHAARLRAQVRDWDDGSALEALLGRAGDVIDASYEPGGLAARHRLATGRAALVDAVVTVRGRRRSLDDAVAGMATALHEPLRSDHALAERLASTLHEVEEELRAAMRAADRVIQSTDPSSDINRVLLPSKAEHLMPVGDRTRVGPSGPPLGPPPDAMPPADAMPHVTPPPPARIAVGSPNGHQGEEPPVLIRMGFGVDVVGYSLRSHPQMEAVQRRLADMIHAVLADIGVRLADTDHQSQGDSMKVFLPAALEIHKVLPRLLHCWYDQLSRDNRRHEDRIRIRMSVGVGPIGVAALGFAGDVPVEIARLVDSDLSRQAVIDHPESDLVVLISHQLHRWAIVPWRPGVVPPEFRQVRVIARGFDDNAWLWIAPPAATAES